MVKSEIFTCVVVFLASVLLKRELIGSVDRYIGELLVYFFLSFLMAA